MKTIYLALLIASPVFGVTCDGLTGIALPNATVTSAQIVAAGAFTPPPGGRGGGRGGASYESLPAFCRVAATLKPTGDSDIKIEVWLPVAGWNGKLQAVGNGGWAGNISYPALATALAAGYAGASTDTGHVGSSASFAVGHPEKVIDYGYRSVHEMTVKAKAIIDAYYGQGPKYSYWNGCSTGGKQGLTEAQRYPADFDGVVAGASANYMIHLHAAQVAMAQAIHRTPDSYIPATKYPLLHNAVLEACDALDGVKDGVLEDPARCRFDPRVLACAGAETASCLTAAQVESARAIYAPVKNPATGETVFPGLAPGSELGWGAVAGPQPIGIPMETFKYVIFQDANWDWHTFNLAADLAKADKTDGGVNNAIDPNLKPFFDRGGKLLMYHGWADNQITPFNSVNYYASVVNAVGAAKSRDSIRLFMVPGMGHCGGGEGTDTFDRMGAISDWVEKGKAPERIVASRQRNGAVERTRPLCEYPKVAQWKGSGSTDDAANFECMPPASTGTAAPARKKAAAD